MSKLDIIIVTTMILGVFVLGFSISQMIGEIRVDELIFEESNAPDRIPESEMEIILNCKNLTLKETANCLRDNIKLFYIYNVTDDDIAKEMTLDEIKEMGTDCGGYAFLYERLSDRIGFNSTTNRYKGIKGVHPGHRWTEIWDNDTYCELDLLEVKCHEIDYE